MYRSFHHPCGSLFFLFTFFCLFFEGNLTAQVSDTTYQYIDTLSAGHFQHTRLQKLEEDTLLAEEVNRGTVSDSVLLKKHSPQVAIALSCVVPGAGQIYNKKWWKVPIFYVALGTSSYLIYHNAHQMQKFKVEYRCRVEEGYGTPSEALSMYSTEVVLSQKKYYQRNMEISIAATAIIYVLNIIDAAVDAHLFYFDISENLSMQVSPNIQPRTPIQLDHCGFSLALRWK